MVPLSSAATSGAGSGRFRRASPRTGYRAGAPSSCRASPPKPILVDGLQGLELRGRRAWSLDQIRDRGQWPGGVLLHLGQRVAGVQARHPQLPVRAPGPQDTPIADHRGRAATQTQSLATARAVQKPRGGDVVDPVHEPVFLVIDDDHQALGQGGDIGRAAGARQLDLRGFDSADFWKSKKVGRYIRNRAPGLSLAIADLHTRLQALVPGYSSDAVCLACLTLYLVDILRKHSGPFSPKNRARHLLGAFSLLRDLLGEKTDELLEAIEALLEKHHRASSAIEGFNAALRPHLYVHKGVTQNFLELFRAYYNLRTRRSGRHKGISAHQALTGSPVNDWLSLIGFPPSSAATVH